MKWKILEIIKIAAATFSISILLMIFTLCLMELSSQTNWKESTEYTEDTEFLAEHVDLQILVYGDAISFPQSLNCKQIGSLDKREWDLSNEYVYLFINDLYGKATLTEEKFLELEEYASNNKHFNYVYLGEASLSMISKYVKDEIAEEDLGYRNISYSKERWRYYNLFTKDEFKAMEERPEILDECMWDVLMMGI